MTEPLELNETVSSPAKPQVVTLDVAPTPTKIEQGLESVITKEFTQDERPGYAIFSKICVHCGTQADHTDRKLTKATPCAKCKGTRYRLSDYMSPKETHDVINTRLRYKCVTCGRLYDTPTPCCTANHAMPAGKEPKDGFYCVKCTRIYDTRVLCCRGGRMIPGKYYPAEYAQYLAKPKILMPF